ncbi:MAG: phosphonate ABC transporter ATP-binding protein, partial [Chloroflexi bacterium CG_4_10_14_0_8_um_filter_57_5]
MASIIELERLCKSYGTLMAVDDVSFSIEDGEFVTLLG